MAKGELVERVDPALISRIATLSPGAQRWLKTAVQAIRTMPARSEEEALTPPPLEFRKKSRKRLPPAREPKSEPRPSTPGLEDVIAGKAKLEDVEQYPELQNELEGLGDIIDMLRGLGESRRKRGDEILREEILGEGKSGGTPDDEDDEGPLF